VVAQSLMLLPSITAIGVITIKMTIMNSTIGIAVVIVNQVVVVVVARTIMLLST